MKLILLITFLFANIILPQNTKKVEGAWMLIGANEEQIILFMDNYFSHSSYNKGKKQFIQTRGGSFGTTDKGLIAKIEFNSSNTEEVGKNVLIRYKINGDRLETDINGKNQTWQKADKAESPLNGVWKITARMQEGKVVPIHQTGPRKTLKMLVGTRFQWFAINPETKEFSGTGGGTFEFSNGKYAENIEFFSRDSSRVGARLTFNGKLENGQWHHSGLSSKGDSIYEIWGRINK